MYEPRFKGFPDEYERKIGDTYWQGICDISVEEDKQVKALRDSRLEEGLTTYDEVIKIIKKFPVKLEKGQDEEIEATKKFLKEKFGSVRTITAGASYYAGWHLVFMIKYKKWDEYTKEQQELYEHHGSLIGVKVRDSLKQ